MSPTRQVRREMNGAHWYATEWCPCAYAQAQKVRHEEEEQRKQRVEIANKKDILEDTCGIPNRFWGYTLQASPVRQAHPDLVQALIDDVCDEPNSWYLHGSVGVGKTGLAVAFQHALFFHDDSGMWPVQSRFVNVPALFSKLRAAIRDPEASENDLIEELTEIEFLVLDDIGAERMTPYVQERLFEIVNARYESMYRATFFTSNLSPSQLAKHVGDRIASRIFEMCGREHIRHVTGPNLRLSALRTDETE